MGLRVASRIPVPMWAPLVIAVWACALLLLQWRWPARPWRGPWWRRAVTNAALAMLAVAVAALLVKPVANWTLATQPGAGGLLGLVQWHPVVEGVLGALLLDWTFYWWHRANHRVPLLWRFHAMHHADPDCGVSTALRFHIGELALSAAVRIAQIALIGIALDAYLIYESIFQAAVLFHHANWRLGARLERVLQVVLVTPAIHGSHHSEQRHEGDANYGVVLSCWDRLHRSLSIANQSTVRIGLPGAPWSFLASLILPIRRYGLSDGSSSDFTPGRQGARTPGE